MTPSIALFILLSAMQVADFWRTRRILLAGGREQNPIEAAFIGMLGLEAGILVPKIIMLTIVWFTCMPYPIAIGVFCLGYAGILAYNWKSL